MPPAIPVVAAFVGARFVARRVATKIVKKAEQDNYMKAFNLEMRLGNPSGDAFYRNACQPGAEY